MAPLEVLNRHLDKPNPRPSIAHLKVIGSRAYVKLKHVPRKQKVAPRSVIGYLIGYDSTHIFRIWIPQKRKIIRSREVAIDENLRYNPNDPYIEDLLQNKVPRRGNRLSWTSLISGAGVLGCYTA